jgi:uncharacterized phage protein gp47/JayE
VTFTARRYDEIVRDLLTTLTGGTAHETLRVPPNTPLLILPKHPVRRVSHAEGRIEVPVVSIDPVTKKKIVTIVERDYRFTEADFELISTTSNDEDKDAIRFREKGRRPVPGTMLTINYYPVRSEPVPLTDVTVGSVVRTLLETVGFELALTYQQLEQVYKSAFVDTAEGASLDRVVALAGITRFPGGFPVARLRFSRRPGTSGSVTIPAGTPVTDQEGNRYLTTLAVTMAPGESTREVLAAGETAATPEVAENTLQFLELVIAGISDVTNPEPSRKLAAPENDSDLRQRARGALRGAMRGTVDAIRFGLIALDGVNDVTVTEDPDDPGTIGVSVAFSDDSEEVKERVRQRLDELRPAGIVVRLGGVKKVTATVAIDLTLAGATLPAAEIEDIRKTAEAKIVTALKGIAPGGTARKAPLIAALLGDPRIVDAKLAITINGAPAADPFVLDASAMLDVATPVTITIAFEITAVPPATVSKVTMALPIHLVGAATATEAIAAIDAAVTTYLTTRGGTGGAALTVDSLVGAIRDDTRYAIVRGEVLVTVENAATFLQLTDGVGTYTPGMNETLEAEDVTTDIREGAL